MCAFTRGHFLCLIIIFQRWHSFSPNSSCCRCSRRRHRYRYRFFFYSFRYTNCLSIKLWCIIVLGPMQTRDTIHICRGIISLLAFFFCFVAIVVLVVVVGIFMFVLPLLPANQHEFNIHQFSTCAVYDSKGNQRERESFTKSTHLLIMRCFGICFY